MFKHYQAHESSFIAYTYKLGELSIFCEQYFYFQESREIFMTQVQDSNISAHDILYGWNVILPTGISQMQALSLFQEIPLKRLPFSDISAQLSLLSGSEYRHFEIFRCCPLSQVQFPSLFLKPICHALVFPVPRFLISLLINFHSSSVSMETK